MVAAQNQVVDEAANGLPLPVAPLARLAPQFFSQQLAPPQPLGKVMEPHRSRMTSQVLLPKADVEFAHLSDYLLGVHLLGASSRPTGTYPILSFAKTGGTFLYARRFLLCSYP